MGKTPRHQCDENILFTIPLEEHQLAHGLNLKTFIKPVLAKKYVDNFFAV
jgi:hypothetical protein